MQLNVDKFYQRREDKINQTKTLVMFKIFDRKTPHDLMGNLFYRDNILPLVNLYTRVDYELRNNDINDKECIIYYYFSSITIPPKIEIPNVLYIYREGLDPEFEATEYNKESSYRPYGDYIKHLEFGECERKIQVLRKFKFELI